MDELLFMTMMMVMFFSFCQYVNVGQFGRVIFVAFAAAVVFATVLDSMPYIHLIIVIVFSFLQLTGYEPNSSR